LRSPSRQAPPRAPDERPCPGRSSGSRVPARQVRRLRRQAGPDRSPEGCQRRRPPRRRRRITRTVKHQPPKPILGVDIDNVLADSDVRLRAMIREMCGIDIRAEQMARYEYEAYGVTWEQLVEVLRVF